MEKSVTVGVAAAALISGVAMADYDLEFELSGPGGNNVDSTALLEGDLAGIGFDVNFINEGGFTWAGDLLLTIIDPNGVGMQFGGFDIDPGLPNAGDFPADWDSDVSGNYTYATSVETMGLGGAGVWSFSIIDGYTQGEVTDYWDGVITLEGVSVVPAPGALALLGIAGIAGRRRRR